MKKLIALPVLMMFAFCKGQKVVISQYSGGLIIMFETVDDVKGTVKNEHDTTYKWNKDSLYSICGLKQACWVPWEHYIRIGRVPTEPYGKAVYGPENALIGYLTKYGFAATFHRDHLAGKRYDLELLENPEKMKMYLVKIGIQN